MQSFLFVKPAVQFSKNQMEYSFIEAWDRNMSVTHGSLIKGSITKERVIKKDSEVLLLIYITGGNG